AAKGAGGGGVCGEHQEALKLFCEEDQTPTCVVCDRSQAHRAPKVFPMEEAAQESCQEKIQAHCKPLREEREKLQGFQVTGEGKSWEYLDVRCTLSRWEKGKFQQPVEISPELEARLNNFSQETVALMEILRKCKDTLPFALGTKRGETLGAQRQ
ncbi:unnamed protein product, partial [Eretmochelys imbricata]